MAGGTKKSVKHKRKLSLVHLPTQVLKQIFAYEGIVSPRNLLICRALRAPALHALLLLIELRSFDQVVFFDQALLADPKRFARVKALKVWGPREDGALDPLAWKPSLSGDQRQQLNELVRGILRTLSRLVSLELVGKTLVFAILNEDAFQDGLLSSLRRLRVLLFPVEDYSAPQDARLCRDVAKYLSLQVLTLTGNLTNLPADLLNLSPAVRLPHRSWNIQSLVFNLFILMGPEMRVIWSALSTNLTELYVSTVGAYKSFMHDLALLPPSLRYLTLNFGMGCPTTSTVPSSTFPHFGEGSVLMPDFPALVALALSGDIVNAATFTFLQTSLPSLAYLTLGVHVQLSLEPLLSLLTDCGGPCLYRLTLNICSCPPPSSRGTWRGPPRPNWPLAFGPKKAEELFRVAALEGVLVQGTILCATRQCDSGDGHKCAKFYE
ncbi:hypothetical protein JCM6882_009210 [Rhodosporidiobolus microsporus]